MNIGIIGLGVIGTAQTVLFADHHLVTYDPATHDVYPYAHLEGCEFAVICVGTPPCGDGSADLRQVEAAVSALPPAVPVLLRSTVPPGTSERLLADRLYAYAPEFMGENPAHPWQHSGDVPYLLLGGSDAARAFFGPRLPFPVVHECPARVAEMAKYTANLYWATRVTFVNEIATVCETLDVPYEAVRDAWLNDPRMTADYTRRAGFPPGFDGACWPKDLAAMIAASQHAGYTPRFLEDVRAANGRFRCSGTS